jgi:hypothetical protein
MYVDLEALRQQYADLSDQALLAIRRDDLTEEAQRCYDQEMQRRDLTRRSLNAPPEGGRPEDGGPEDRGNDTRPDWLDDAAEVFSVVVLPRQPDSAADAERAADTLRSAGIPAYVQMVAMERGDSSSGPTQEWRVFVPGKFNLRALAVLDCEFFNPDFEADYRNQLEQTSDEELAEMHPRITLAGVYDRIERATRVYNEELARRGLASERQS